MTASFPIAYEFADPQSAPTVEDAFLAFGQEKGLLLMHSAGQSGTLGRYSFLMADPFDSIVANDADTSSDVLTQIKQQLNKWKTPQIPDLPPMQGGIAGLFSYELNSAFEDVPQAKHNPFPVPALVLGLYDCVIA